MTAVLYASVADLRNVLSSTDSGIGTPAQLSDAQLTLALTSASTRISVYSGTIWDSSSPQWVPPDIFHDLALDLAAFWAWKTYLKGKVIGADHPARIAYENATQMLNDVRDGKIRLDVQAAGQLDEETALILNRIPPIFTGGDSNTRVGASGFLESDVPLGPNWAPRGADWFGAGGPVYQG